MADKELKFKFVLDQASFDRVKTAIQQLTQAMGQFNRAAGGGGGLQPSPWLPTGGGGGGVMSGLTSPQQAFAKAP